MSKRPINNDTTTTTSSTKKSKNKKLIKDNDYPTLVPIDVVDLCSDMDTSTTDDDNKQPKMDLYTNFVNNNADFMKYMGISTTSKPYHITTSGYSKTKYFNSNSNVLSDKIYTVCDGLSQGASSQSELLTQFLLSKWSATAELLTLWPEGKDPSLENLSEFYHQYYDEMSPALRKHVRFLHWLTGHIINSMYPEYKDCFREDSVIQIGPIFKKLHQYVHNTNKGSTGGVLSIGVPPVPLYVELLQKEAWISTGSNYRTVSEVSDVRLLVTDILTGGDPVSFFNCNNGTDKNSLVVDDVKISLFDVNTILVHDRDGVLAKSIKILKNATSR